MQHIDVQGKVRASYSKFEGNHPMRDPSVLKNRQDVCFEKIGYVDHTQTHISENSLTILQDREQLQSLYDDIGHMSEVATTLGVYQSTVQRYMALHGCVVNQSHMQSHAERTVGDFIESLGFTIEHNNRAHGFEIDILVPDLNVGVEFNGVFWHSSKFKHRSYHQRKSLDCEKLGIQLIHIWEDDWADPHKQEILKQKLRAKLGVSTERVYARKTEVRRVKTEDARPFLDKHHIQGRTTATHWYGLYYGNELSALLGMKKTKNDGVWDLVRYVSSKTVVGGFSKLLKHFKDNHEWVEIFTFASLDYSHGTVYEKTGFIREHVTAPCLWYVKGDKRIRREKFMKHKLEKKLVNFDPNLSEQENMRRNGFLIIHDSGSIRYSMKKPDQ